MLWGTSPGSTLPVSHPNLLLVFSWIPPSPIPLQAGLPTVFPLTQPPSFPCAQQHHCLLTWNPRELQPAPGLLESSASNFIHPISLLFDPDACEICRDQSVMGGGQPRQGSRFVQQPERSEEGVAPSLGNMGFVPGAFPPRANTLAFCSPLGEYAWGAEGSGWTIPAPSTVRPSPPEPLAPGLSSLPHPSPVRIW